MAFTVRRFLCARVSGGANAGGASVTAVDLVASPLARAEFGAFGDGANADRALSSRPDFAASPIEFAGRCALGNGAVRKLTVHFLSQLVPCVD